MEQPKLIVLTAMHGRHSTVKYCMEKMPFIEKVIAYTTHDDEEFLSGIDKLGKVWCVNEPLSKKWNDALKAIRHEDFDAIIVLGSDDYIDEAFVRFVSENIDKYDAIGFRDIYYEKDGQLYYWSGYEGKRHGEPIGAGKVFTKAFLEKIDFNLWTKAKNSGLDGVSWKVTRANTDKILTASIKEEGLILVDVKDEPGMNTFEQISKKGKLTKRND